MRIPGTSLELSLTTKAPANLAPVEGNGIFGDRSWYSIIRESFTGAWQQNIEVALPDVLTYPTAWACVTLIASDIAKLAVKLAEPTKDDIWNTIENPAYSPVLRKPNPYQTHVQFYEYWMISKLTRGNAYVLKIRDSRRVVTEMYVLDPCRVKPLVAPDGSVFYDVNRDELSTLREDDIVPAREIIHDRFNCLYHPLVGLSPLHASGLAATQGLKIQTNTTNLFSNGGKPGGILTAPGEIAQPVADRMKARWDATYSGANVGKVAVLGSGLTYEPIMMNAVDSDLVKQLGWSDEKICATFHVPAYMVGVGPYPSYNNVQALAQQYYAQCLQVLLESIEVLLDEGLGLVPEYRSMFDTESLLRMDSATMMQTIKDGVGAGVLKPNEGRNKLNYAPVEGGDTPYLQVQNYSLAALDKRDQAGPPVTPSPAPSPPPEPETPAAPPDEDKSMLRDALFGKVMRRLSRAA